MDILLVEDNDIDARVMQRHVPLSARVDIARTMGDAFQLLSTHEYDVIICDLNLPDSDPEQTIQRMSDVDAEVIFISSSDGFADAANGFVHKQDMSSITQLVRTLEAYQRLSTRLSVLEKRVDHVVDLIQIGDGGRTPIMTRLDIIDTHIEHIGERVADIHESVKEAVVSKRAAAVAVITGLLGIATAIAAAVAQ